MSKRSGSEASSVSDLDVLLRDEPGPVRQQSVERLQAAEFGGRMLQAAQPALVASGLQEARAVLLHQVEALVSSCGLQDENVKQNPIISKARFHSKTAALQ